MNDNRFSKKEAELISYYEEVVRYLAFLGLDKDYLLDAVQEIYIDAFAGVHRLRDDDKLKYWLMKIAMRKGRRYQKKQNDSMKQHCSLDEYKPALVDESLYVEDAATPLMYKEDVEALNRSLRKLKDKERFALVMHYGEGIKAKDISAMLNENLNNTKSIIRRAKIKVREDLEKGGYNDGK